MSSEVNELNFVANARLKDIVGRGLIYNDNIALIELIKNAKDADSAKVELIFNNANKEDNTSKIIIRDFGKGMSLDDIKNKWLNIAYSSKRNKLKEDGKAYAGNKGVGRFSCDRLGKKLDLYTIKKEASGYHLSLNWEDYEVDDPNIEISDKKINVFTKTKEDLSGTFGTTGFTSGTVLVISDLRNTWEFNNLDKLKKELEKFVVCPTDEMSVGDFDVIIETNYLNENNQKEIDGLVENKVFSELEFRTTSIESSISKDGKVIETTLKHDGNKIFTITEKNLYSKLKNIKSKLYYLNQPSKTFFTKKTGYKHLEYGSVLLFLNSFRIFPYGEPGDDWLDLDKRKAQGYNRYLGTRELVGYVTVEDSENFFIPVSAREGLVVNEPFIQLKEIYDLKDFTHPGFISKALRKLEKFVVDGLDWDRIPNADKRRSESFNGVNPEEIEFVNRDKEILDTLSSVIYLGVKKESILDVKINSDYIQALAKDKKENYRKLQAKLIENGIYIPDLIKNDKDVVKLLEEQEKKLKQKEETNIRLNEENVELEQEVQQSKEIIKEKEKDVEKEKEIVKQKEQEVQQSKEVIKQKEKEVETHKEKVKQKEKTIEQLNSENFFLRRIENQEVEDLILHMHDIVTDSETINNEIARFSRRNELTPELLDFIERIKVPAQRINKRSHLATLYNFRDKDNEINGDLITFIKKYINEISKIRSNQTINFIDNLSLEPLIKSQFIPLEIISLVDNIVSNSKKAKTNKIEINSYREENKIVIQFNDNGIGLSEEIKNKESLFEKGVTYTKGSGLGLYQIRKIITKLKGETRIVDTTEGFCLEVLLNEA